MVQPLIQPMVKKMTTNLAKRKRDEEEQCEEDWDQRQTLCKLYSMALVMSNVSSFGQVKSYLSKRQFFPNRSDPVNVSLSEKPIKVAMVEVSLVPVIPYSLLPLRLWARM